MTKRSGRFLGLVAAVAALGGFLPGEVATGAIIYSVETRLHSESGINVSQPIAPFSTVPNLSAVDYASPARRNNVQLQIAAGTPQAGSGGVGKLVDGLWPWDGDRDAPSQVLFSDSGDLAVQFDLRQLVDIWRINTYSRHVSNRTPQVYTVYGSSAAVPPTTNGDPTGWTLIASVDTRNNSPGPPYGTTGTSLDGIAGASIYDDAGGPLGQYQHLLFVLQRPGTYGTFYGEIDIVTGSHPIITMESRYHGDPDNVGSGPITTNPFQWVPTVSNKDYADASQGHGVTATIVAGAKSSGSGAPSVLLDGQWPSSWDAPGQVLFDDGNYPFRVLFDLKDRLSVEMINTFSRHTQATNPSNGARTPQVYTLYGIDADTPPSATGDLIANGWIPIAVVDTRPYAYSNGTGTNLPGVAGVSITPLDGISLGVYRYLLFDFQPSTETYGTFYAEIDIFGTVVPEPASWLLVLFGLTSLGLVALRKRICGLTKS